jgi:alcohol dehydrogenase class IV
MAFETAFSMDTSSIKFGPGVTREVGHDMRQMGGSRVMVVTDRHLAESEPVAVAVEALRSAGIDTALFDQARVEPTDSSLKEAIGFAVDGRFDGYVAVGGGSSIDTAKAADLYASCPADFMTYVNPPIGEGRPVPGRLAPLIAIPTTAGTGSETTGVIVFDLPVSTPRPPYGSAPLAQLWASSTPSTREPCRGWWRRVPGSTWCATRSSR